MGIRGKIKYVTGFSALLLGLPMAAAIAPTPAFAQANTLVDIPAGRLASAIRTLARQAGISIATRDSGIRSIRSRAVRGAMTPREALDLLLEGTPYRAVALGNGRYRIEKRALVRSARRVASTTARTAPAPSPPSPPIIVEASKRTASASDYPGGLSVISIGNPAVAAIGEGLDAALADLPSVNGTALGQGRNKIFLRGIADSSFNGPTQSTIGLYLGEQRLIFSAPNPDLRLYDVEAVELLEGPQGTLYGAGTIAGLLRINPRQPDASDIAASAWAGLGTTHGGGESWDLGGMANLPLGQSAALRLVGYGGEDGGYIDDPSRRLSNINAGSYYGGRAAFSADLGPDWSLELTGFAQKSELEDGQYVDAARSGLTRTDQIRQPFETQIYGGSLTLRGYLGNAELVSTTGMVDHHLRTVFDSSILTGDPSRQAFRETRDIRLITHETRLSGGDPDHLDWLIGLGALRDRDAMRQLVTNLDGDNPPPFAELVYRLDEIAAFGEASYHFAPDWSVTAGARVLYTRAEGERSFGPNTVIEPRKGPARVLPALALRYKPSATIMAYARYERGFRTGGVTIERDQNRDPVTALFDPDKVQSYEAGIRAGVGSGRQWQLSLTGHYTDWKDIQADLVDIQGFPITRNIGTGEVLGADASLQWDGSGGWSLALSASVNDTNVDRLLPMGGVARVRIPNVPDLSLAGRVSKVWDLSGKDRLGLSLAGRYMGKSFLDIDQQVRVEQGDFGAVDAAAWWKKHELQVRIEALNLSNTRGNRFAFGNPFTVRTEDQSTPLRPRTLRIQISLTH